jgi:hypothetical protein
MTASPPYNERAGLDEPARNGSDTEDQEPARIDAIAPRPFAKPARRIPVSKEWVKFSDIYGYMELLVWVDAPARIMEGLGPQQVGESLDETRDRVMDTLGQIVLAHRFDDGSPWSDEEGELPPPQDRAFWDRAPQPIVNAIIAYIRDRINNHPTLRRLPGTPRR